MRSIAKFTSRRHRAAEILMKRQVSKMAQNARQMRGMKSNVKNPGKIFMDHVLCISEL